MRPEVAVADRHREIREAARAWRRARVIDPPTLAAIEAVWPDDRVRVGPVFRVLLFLFTIFAIAAAVLLASERGFSGMWLALAAGIACVALTELQVGRLKRAQGGTEAATSFLALVFLMGAFLAENPSPIPAAYFLAWAILAALAAWRWGYSLYAAGAAVFLFLFLARLPGARLWWAVVPLIVLWPLLLASESPRLTPSHRRGVDWMMGVALAALYTALHLGSYDSAFIEKELGAGSLASAPGGVPRWFFITTTALLPGVVLAFGVRTRRRLLINAGLLMGVASLVTLRFYVHVAPLWVVLTVAGGVTVALIFFLRRLLASGPAQELSGFTAEPLFENLARRSVLEVGASVSILSPAAGEAAREEPFKGGGGTFGGGGASEKY